MDKLHPEVWKCSACDQAGDAHLYQLPFELYKDTGKSQKDDAEIVDTIAGLSCLSCVPNSVAYLKEKLLTKPTYHCIQGNHDPFTHNGPLSHAYDFDLKKGTPVLAARDGIVTLVLDCFGDGGLNPNLMSKANLVYIRHDQESAPCSNSCCIGGEPKVVYSRYVHLEKGTVRVQVGEKVRCGQIIAKSGNSGYSGGPHLHFDVTDCEVNEICELMIEYTKRVPISRKQSEVDVDDVVLSNRKNISCTLATFSDLPPTPESPESRAPWVDRANLIVADPIHLESPLPGEFMEKANCDTSLTSQGNDWEAVKQSTTFREGIALICKRGNVDFLRKSQHAEESGAKLLIVVDNDPSAIAIVAGIGKDGVENFGIVGIPVLFVTCKDGEEIIELCRTSEVKVSVSRHPYFKISQRTKTVLGPDGKATKTLSAIQPVTVPVRFENVNE